MKKVEVVAAIIVDQDKVLIAQRKTGEFAGMWEFPGGKIEPGETHSIALQREIKEEMEVSISVDNFFMTVDYDYASFHLTMHCYICALINREILLNDHLKIEWVSLDQLKNFKWLSADLIVVENLINFQLN